MAKQKNTRASAATCLALVISKGESLTVALQKASNNTDERDLGLLREMCFGVMRHYYSLHAITKSLLSKSLKPRDTDVLALIMLGIYQLAYMRIPDHAALNETVSGTRALNKPWARGLVNALLRKYQRDSESLLSKFKDDAQVTTEHPQWLQQRLQKAWPEHAEQVMQANQQHAPMSLRVNCRHHSRGEYLASLQAQDIAATAIKETEFGLQLETPVAVEKLPGFDVGHASVQDGAAQLASGLLAAQAGDLVLDACAAPGGKTAAIIESCAECECVAIDNDGKRLARVEENLSRIDLQATLICEDVGAIEKWWDKRQFDRILLDAPCSATGVIRRHPDIKLLRRDSDIANLATIQSSLLAAIWPTLKLGGRLVYATCSVLQEENSLQIEAFLKAHQDASEVIIDADWGRKAKAGRQLLPGESGMDGFYYAVIEKSS